MAKNSKRASKTSSGVGKNRAGKNVARRTPVSLDPSTEQFLRQQQNNRWPTQDSEHLYFELNTTKQPVNRPANRIKQPNLGFALLESIPAVLLDRILTCSSLKYKSVKRFPGWILQRVYNLKSRPISFV